MAKAFRRKDTKTWYVRHKGVKILVGKDQKAAKHLADKINLEKAEGKAGIYRLNEKNIEDYLNEILDYKKSIRNLKPKSLARYKSIFKNFLTFLSIEFPKTVNLSQLDQAIFEEYIRYRKTNYLNKNGAPVTDEQLKTRKDNNLKTGASDKTIKMEIETLKSMLQYAVKNRDTKKRYLQENPLEHIEPTRVNDQTSKRPLTEEEINTFLSYMIQKDKELYEIFYTFLYTGIRDGELRHIEWSDIDLNKKIITLKEKQVRHKDGTVELWTPKTKKGKREIPIHNKLLSILKERKNNHQDTSDFVFPDHNGGILKRKLRRELIRAMRAIGINDFTRVHDLRRTFISFLAMQGVPRETTMDIVGHVDESTYELYRESSLNHRIESVNKLNYGT